MKKALLFGLMFSSLMTSVYADCIEADYQDEQSAQDEIQWQMKQIAAKIVAVDAAAATQAFATSCAAIALYEAYKKGKFTLTAGVTTAIALILDTLPTRSNALVGREIYRALLDMCREYAIGNPHTFSTYTTEAYMSDLTADLIPAFWSAVPFALYFSRA